MNEPKSLPQAIPFTGILLLMGLSLLWGANMVGIKISTQGVPPLMAAAARSIGAAFLVWVYVSWRGAPVFMGRADRKHGMIIGLLFGVEFLFLYWGISYTDASRAVIFLYTHPFWTAAAAHFLLPGDRLTWWKSAGLCLAFAGLLSVFVSRPATLGPLFWVGDLMELAAAALWAATTVYIKKFIRNRPVTYQQTLFAQLFYSIPVLVAGALIFEWGRPLDLTPLVVWALVYQTVVVAFFSYLFWFWLIHTFPVSRLAAFTFFTPLFGVILSGLILGETITTLLWIGLALVAAGIALVNRPDPGTRNAAQ